jgi:hypothetical protein
MMGASDGRMATLSSCDPFSSVIGQKVIKDWARHDRDAPTRGLRPRGVKYPIPKSGTRITQTRI